MTSLQIHLLRIIDPLNEIKPPHKTVERVSWDPKTRFT